jgi:hypothetical protein
VKTGPWAARDNFIAETAIKLDRLQAKLDRMYSEGEIVKQHVTELMESAHQLDRLQAFEESLRNGREYKLDDLVRSVKDLKTRLDVIEGSRTTYGGLTYKSFDAVDKKLAELNAFQLRVRAYEKIVRINAVFFMGGVLLLATTLIVRFA